ncbi:MAG TPA: hypothetical protein VGS22_18205 [Thermoanaerobaculia bacterium]|jgi:hypothetical protein|nr:hypothetical protein [Thermoanaerobaculia bacterium]
MKPAFVLALALFALSLPASAAAAPEVSSSVQAPAADSNPDPIFLGPKPYCWIVEGTTCSPLGSTTPCTDACSNPLSCTCRSYIYYNETIFYWDCMEAC